MYSRQASVWMVNPGGTGKPAFVISARPAPLPPRTSFMRPLPSAEPPPKKYTYLVAAVEVEFAAANSTSTAATKYVYFFGGGSADGNGRMKDVLGGKGAGLAEMTNAGLQIPPGFTIQTEACREYMRGAVSAEVDVEMYAALEHLEKLQGQKLGTGENPLLVSVRSGAKFSMPGMMDTILNLGLNDQAVEALAKLSNNPRFAYDSYRRLIQM